MPRLKPVSRKDVKDPAILERFEQFFPGGIDPVEKPGTPTGTPGNWWTVLSNHEAALKGMHAFSYTHCTVDAKLRELAMTRTGYAKGSQFVYSQHSKGARRSGLSEEQVQSIAYWNVANCYSELQRAVLALTDGMVLEAGRVHDKVFEILKAHLSEGEIIELVHLINSFAGHATTSKVLRLEYDDVPDRIVEIPVPKTKRVQDHLKPETWDK